MANSDLTIEEEQQQQQLEIELGHEVNSDDHKDATAGKGLPELGIAFTPYIRSTTTNKE